MPRPSTASRTAELAGRLGMATTRLARLLRQQDEGALTPTMRAALGTIARQGPLTLGDLASVEQVAPPTVTKVVAKLEEAGLVERTGDPADRRVTRVGHSEAGRDWMDDDRRRRRRWLAARLEGLAPDDIARLAAAIDVIEALTGPVAPEPAPDPEAGR